MSSIEALCARGGGFIDADTAAVPDTWEAALRAAGGAVALVDALLGGSATHRRVGAAAARPPRRARAGDGVLLLRQRGGRGAAGDVGARRSQRVLILDWDVHHGNGTEAIFAADSDVLFVSIHEWPLYPGTGPPRTRASGRARATRSTCRCPSGSGDAAYRSLVEHVAAPLIALWEPQLVLVSAGFDAHRDDPLAHLHASPRRASRA